MKASSVFSSAKSARSKKTAIEVKTYRALAVIDDGLAEKEAELEGARLELSTIRKKITVLKENWPELDAETLNQQHGKLLEEEIVAEDLLSKLEIVLKLERAKAERQKNLILLEKDADLDDIQSESESDRQAEAETAKKEQVKRWIMEQGSQPVVIPDGSAATCERGAAGVQVETQVADDSSIKVNDLVKALHTFGASAAAQKLPTRGGSDYELPKFGGEPERWIQFREEYYRTTTRFRLEDSENLLRLRKALVGAAKQTVQHLMANVRNVNVIMESLEKRFGRPRIVINALAARAKSCGFVTLSKPETIIDLGLAVQALVTNIMTFGETGYIENIDLLDTLVKKLSPDLATRWFEWLAVDRNRIENLSSFADWTSLQLDIAYQRAEVVPDDAFDEKRERRHVRRGAGGQFHTSTSSTGITSKNKCVFCGREKHTIDKCFAFKKKTVDDRWAAVKALKPRVCFVCLRDGHSSADCKEAVCGLDGCTRMHHKLLHNPKPRSKEESKDDNTKSTDSDADEGNFSLCQGSVLIVKGCDGPLPIVPVKVRGPTSTVKCHALLDTGASRSIMRSTLADSIGLTGKKVTYSYKGITGNSVTDTCASLVDCDIAGTLRGDKYYKLSGVVTVHEFRMTPYSINIEEVKRKWPHLKNVAAVSLVDVVPDIIVGNNNPHLILARKLVTGDDEDPIGWRSNLGWTIAGNLQETGKGSVNLSFGNISSDLELHELIKTSFSFEDFGVKIRKYNANNLEEKRAYEILEKTTRQRTDGVWETGLLWRQENVSFPNTEGAALNRLKYVERKMKDPVYAEAYKKKMAEYLEKGYMRKLSHEEMKTKTQRTNIIPHFGHVNPNKPGKFRFILDAKAATNGVSLNSQLLKGPDLIQPLVSVLWNFRRYPFALTGDITDMFHRISIREEDQDSQRLLWRDGDSSREPDHYVMTVMIFGSTCSPASAIYVKNTNAELYKQKYPTAAEVTVNSFYVDDVLICCDSEEELAELRKQLTEIHSAGNFRICKWLSNSKQVINTIPVDLRADGIKDFNDKDIPGERVLGLWWDAATDTFGFKLGLHKVDEKVLNGEVPTKRQMCGLIMSLYDPLGFLAHFKIKGLMLLQEVWRDGTGWDDEIQMSVYHKWKIWIGRLEEIKKVSIPRCYSPHVASADSIQLHIFTDASSEALAAVCYLRVQKDDVINIALVNAKAKVAPLKKTTIPRMELQGALLGCRLASSVQERLRVKFNSVHFWVDSTTVLFWIRSRAGRLKEFVANRIGEIQEATNPEQWHWVPTKLNIADQATRFDSEISFSPDCQWYSGPSFLFDTTDSWNFEEGRLKAKETRESTIVVVEGECGIRYSDARCTTPAPERFSSYTRLVRATAAVMIAARHWLARVRSRQAISASPYTLLEAGKSAQSSVIVSGIQAADIHHAEMKLIKLAQEESFDVKQKKNQLWRLSPIMDENGIIRVDSRIQATEGLAFTTRSPIILPPRHHVTNLIVHFEHESNAHQGTETVLANLRKKYWIVDGRHTVTRAFRRCQVCRLQRAKPLTPRMGQIPSIRLLSQQPPFYAAGVDLFGPFEVTVGRRHEKRWGVLFCCMVTRCIHLEVVHALSTDEFMMSLSRFIDTRGRPRIIASDNGTNFVGAARVLEEKWACIDVKRIQQDSRFQRIQWQFNPPLAPHMGGAWERLIQLVKKCLFYILKDKYPRDTVLLTALKGAENMVNSRPLTHLSNDVSDPGAITPNHILRGSCHNGPAIPSTVEASDHSLRDMWGMSQVIQDQFWEHWNRHYLPKLIHREKWHRRSPSLQIGDIVSLVDDTQKSNFWKRGYVSRIFPGPDKEVRVVEVTVRDPDSKKQQVYRRAVTRVCPLGLQVEIKDQKDP